MYEYIIGKVTMIESNHIVLDNNNIGYLIYVGNPYSYKLNEEAKVYLYQHIREDENTLYGFRTMTEKEMFLRLIDVKGLGCKMALPMLASGNTNDLWEAIENENIHYLKKFPKIGDKVARQIVFDLKGKLSNVEVDKTMHTYEELVEVLKGLGYKPGDIKAVVDKVDANLPIEKQVKEALKLLLK